MPEKFVKKFKTKVKSFRRGDFDEMPPFFQHRGVQILFLLVLVSTVTFLTTVSLQYIPSNMQEGMISSRDIKADRNYEIVDIDATDKFKQEALASVMPVYDFDDLVADSIAERIKLAFANTRVRYEALLEAKEPVRRGDKPNLTEQEVDELKEIFAQNLGVTPTMAQWKLLIGEKFDQRSEDFLIDLIKKVLERPIVPERAALDAQKDKGIVIRRMALVDGSNSQELKEAIIKDVSEILSTNEARELVDKVELTDTSFRNPAYPEKLRDLVKELVEPNFALNRSETQNRKDVAVANVKNVTLKVKTGEMIIREGSRYEPLHIKILEGIQKEKRRGLYFLEFIGTWIFVFLLIVVPFYLAEKFFRRIRPTRSDHFLMAFIGLSIFIIVRVSIMLAPAFQSAIFFNAPIIALHYAIPIAGGAMLLRMYLGAEITMIFAVSMSALSGLLLEADVPFFIYLIMTGLAAVIAVANIDKRSAIIRAGLITGGVGIVVIVGASAVELSSVAESITLTGFIWSIVLALLGGIACAIYSMITAPIVESLSGYTSDIKLLELANLNHPLLRELIVRAPGTYHHSHLVGVLGEAAAEAVGANALLVRVGAYYHDIGKMKKPSYFIENTKGGSNKHEKLSPNMSSLIISAHVKDGIDMANSAHIPKVITDMIPQHHGTRLMGFFYSKAKESEDPTLSKADEKDFRYPGPKPQSREAAILMLADTTEASVRALKEKSSTRIQQTVQRAINDIFAESQLDECELTLQDLNDIAKAFVRILLGIYHQRIEYPDKEQNDKLEVNVIDESSTRQADDDQYTS